MAEPTTFIKIDRNIREWRWYKDANTMRVFVDLLIDANITAKEYEGITVYRGETATSYQSIADRLKLTIKQVRTAVNHLKRTGEVATKKYPKFQVISILNYDKYQQIRAGSWAAEGQSEGSQRAVKGQQLKNNKNIRNKEIKNKGGGAAGFSGFTMEGFADFLNGEDDDE